MKASAFTPLALLCTLGITGCASSLDAGSPGYYTLDLERTVVCYQGDTNCLNLELIIPSYNESRIAQAYQLPPTSADWNVRQLVDLMLAPPDNLYQARQVSDYRYEIPRNSATNTVWYYLEYEQFVLYEAGGENHD